MSKVKDIKIISVGHRRWRVELNGNDQGCELDSSMTLTLVKGVMGDILKSTKEASND